MSTNLSRAGKTPLIPLLLLALVGIGGAALTQEHWQPVLFPGETTSLLEKLESHSKQQSHDDHAGHDHDAHAAGRVVELSQEGLKNIGFEPFVVKITDYQRMLSLPAIVVERPGRSQIIVAAPLTGVITKIHAVPGEAVVPGQLLFEIRLTHEELVAAQRDFLRNVENLDVVNREIKRLQSLGEGVVAGRRVLEQEYEKQKLVASLHAESQAMLLHGLSSVQVEQIRESRRLFQNIEIRVPEHRQHEESCDQQHPFLVQELAVAQGQQIEAGGQLAVLGDHCELLLEAIAFEDDAPQIREAAKTGRKITARQQNGKTTDTIVTDLEVLYTADQIDAESRAIKTYLRLPNKLVLDNRRVTGKRFVEWLYKPGQRMQVHVPVETWKNQLVLPTDAVVVEGAEAYVYHQHGTHFDQVSVHVLHRDQTSVVVANEGTLKIGNVIAGNCAYLIHLTLKNQSGGGIDPHAGHSH